MPWNFTVFARQSPTDYCTTDYCVSTLSKSDLCLRKLWIPVLSNTHFLTVHAHKILRLRRHFPIFLSALCYKDSHILELNIFAALKCC